MRSQNDEIVDSSLEFIGLNPSEISVYRALLTLGPRPASTVAKRVGMQRTRVYDVLLSLESRGLVEVTLREKIRHFSPAPRNQLIQLITNRRHELAQKVQQFESIIPSLFDSVAQDENRVEVNRIRGARQAKELLESLLTESSEELIAIGDLERDLQLHPPLSRWSRQFRSLRIKRGIQLKVAVQGPPDLLEERGLLRETLSSPDIPSGQLLIVTKSQLYFIDLSSLIQITTVENEMLSTILRGLYLSWGNSVKRIC